MPDDTSPPPSFDPTETQRHREPISAGNRDLLENMNTRLELLESQFVEQKEMLADKFDMLARTMRSSVVILAQAPISITGILIASGFLYLGKLVTWEWMVTCGVLLYPLYGEGIAAFLSKLKGKG